ncbi:helix-turn-helix domain-containing protein [Halocatena salina]|uniref:Helix-turn-helix domain-containing protein n=1 Tax=Halocatena salina TaxID=2934340 RepID=A0A8U0A3Q4_9EURY|nr:helix-turn-helix domain-containing protein [Halocatena salina]UPM43712.1 helix-turn-helix domain-containing protein [Halocatena salina]
MKYLTLSLGPTDRAFHPIDRHLTTQEHVTRETLLHLDIRFNETYLVLYHLTGPRSVIETAITTHETVLDHEIVSVDGDDVYAYIHLDVSNTDGHLVELAHDHSLIIDTPITFDADGMNVTLVGNTARLGTVLQSVPGELTVSVRNAGRYDPGTNDLLASLTDRQREVFETAVEAGYYDVPRRVTHRDIAGELDCAPSTVDEHLRKAESAVVPHLF